MCNEDSSQKLPYREIHSSSSGESGYDSIPANFCNSEGFVVFDALPKILPTVTEFSNLSNYDESPCEKTFTRPDGKTIIESVSCDELYIINGVSSPKKPKTTKKYLLRSNSCNNIPPNKQCVRAPKPPIPPCSPSIQERRRQLAMKANGSAIGNKCQNARNGDLTSQSFNSYAPYVVPQTSTSEVGHTDFCYITHSEEFFVQAQHDIDILLARLEEAHENRLRNATYMYYDMDKFVAAKEALVTESRQFVTSSKLFVKCATEASPQLLEHVLECVSLLERMYSLAEIVLLHMESQAQITCLVDRLKECAATFAYTVDTVHKLVNTSYSPANAASSPYMGLLMNHATSLATSLSALMRTLRALNS